ncbi:MAG: helix-turn-helix transcriptional regulator [Nitrososphaerota archaeon]
MLRKLRKKKEITQKELAERLGVSQPYISMLERGKRFPTLRIAMKLADIFGVPIEQLFPKRKEGEENGSPS